VVKYVLKRNLMRFKGRNWYGINESTKFTIIFQSCRDDQWLPLHFLLLFWI